MKTEIDFFKKQWRINKLKSKQAIRAIELPGNQRKERRMSHMCFITVPLRDHFFQSYQKGIYHMGSCAKEMEWAPYVKKVQE